MWGHKTSGCYFGTMLHHFKCNKQTRRMFPFKAKCTAVCLSCCYRNLLVMLCADSSSEKSSKSTPGTQPPGLLFSSETDLLPTGSSEAALRGVGLSNFVSLPNSKNQKNDLEDNSHGNLSHDVFIHCAVWIDSWEKKTQNLENFCTGNTIFAGAAGRHTVANVPNSQSSNDAKAKVSWMTAQTQQPNRKTWQNHVHGMHRSLKGSTIKRVAESFQK